jgi:hypothetical protein
MELAPVLIPLKFMPLGWGRIGWVNAIDLLGETMAYWQENYEKLCLYFLHPSFSSSFIL